MKLFKRCIFIFLFIFLFSVFAKAEDVDEIYNRQFNLSGAEKIIGAIPKESKNSLDDMGIKSMGFNEISNLSLEKIFFVVFKIAREKIYLPFKSFGMTVSIMLFCILFESIYPPLRNKEMSKTLNLISSLLIAVSVLNPVSRTISLVSFIIKSACNFISCYVPVMVAIMVASGKIVSATSYHAFLIFAGQVIFKCSETFFIPILNILLGISVISSLSSNLKLGSLSGTIMKILKSLLEIVSVLFTGVITLQNLVSNSADSLKSSVAKCIFGQCVPIVGSMVSDAYGTVQGCLGLLKSGVGVFGIIAGAVIFLPAFVECGLWIMFLNFSSCIANVLEIKSISSLTESVANVMRIAVAILTFSLVILIVSSAVVILIGGR